LVAAHAHGAVIASPKMALSHQTALSSRDDLKTFGRNARLLFALETRFRLDDIATVAANALTDGPDDKKCDLVFVDREGGIVIIAQGYESDKDKASAPANKASDLNTATSWLLSRPINELPEGLRSAAAELRSALTDGDIRTVQAWFVHNLPESENVNQELQTVENTLLAGIKQHFKDSEVDECRGVEVGINTLEEWYQALEAPILVTEEIDVPIPGSYEIKGDNWTAVVTTVPASWLHELWRKHQSKLFSANVRDYLGSRRSARNVNHNIKKTAAELPQRFWAYNNGITALVNDYTPGGTTLKMTGISIVNGAQTTGALGSLGTTPEGTAAVQARFVKCSDTDTIRDIIQYNNTQNAVEVADFRSNDGVQRRLRDEFDQIPNATYLGGRRGGDADLIKRTPNLMPSDTCGQALAAFHQEPATAYNSKSAIWENDALYSTIFSDDTSAKHIVFALSLLRAVEARKKSLADKTTRTQQEEKQFQFLRSRGSTFLFVAAIASCLETFLSRPIPNSFRASFGKVSPETAATYWAAILDATAPFCSKLQPALDFGFKNKDNVRKALAEFQAMVEATKEANANRFAGFAANVIVD
jgi:hypothetical protein